MEVRILGPVEPALPPKPAQILAVLAVECGRIVPVERMIDLIWGEDPPPQARKSLQVHISCLRRSGLPVEHRASGYMLAADPEQVDLHVFRALVAEATETTDPAVRSDKLGRALRLWRGAPPVHGQTLDVQRLAAIEAWVDAELALGRYAEVLDPLSSFVVEYPLAERLRGHLMTALARCGRRADAMRVFRDTRRTLVDELGVEPGDELQQLHRKLLDGAGDARRNYLPRDAGDFTGRAEELERVLGSDGGAVWWIEGPAGVGKSALAVHAAHLLADRYPDGQLFVDLHSPSGALDALLRAMDVPSERIPESHEERAALWRAQISARRLVIVLDGVTSVSQVRSLLPGSPGCLTLITSRSRLCGLEGVRRLPLDVLSQPEAVTLLARILGDDRVALEPMAAAEVARLCGYLPLAVRITGARLAGRAHWPVSKLVSRLADERSRLDELVADDLAVRSSLELTYRALEEQSRHTYRMIGFLGLPELPSHLWAPLLDEDVLDRLVDARLLDVTGSARYRMHELVRLHARELAEREDAESARLDFVRRAVLASLSTVDGLTEQLFLAVPRMQDPVGLVPTAPPADRDAWFAREEQLLTRTVERAAELGLAELASQLAEALVFAWFGLRNRYEAWERTHTAALDAVRRTGDLRLEAVLRCSLGQMHYKRDNLRQAQEWFDAAQTLFVALGDRRGEAVALNGSGSVSRDLGRYDRALEALGRARELLTSLVDTEGAAHALYGIGSVQRELGLDDESVGSLLLAEDAYRKARSRRGEALAARGIGLVHRARGELDAAAAHCERAHEMVAGTGDVLLTCYTAQAWAKVLLRQGFFAEAEPLLAKALDGCREVGDRFGVALMRRTAGELRLAEGDFAGAGVLLSSALDEWDSLGMSLWRARTLRDLGAVHACRGDVAGADRCWDEAALLFAQLGTRESGEVPQWAARWSLATT